MSKYGIILLTRKINASQLSKKCNSLGFLKIQDRTINYVLTKHFHNPISRKKKSIPSEGSDHLGDVKIFNFKEQATKMIDTIKEGITPILSMNKYEISTDDQGDLIVDVGPKGFYKFHICYKTESIRLTSPISGSKVYEYDIEEKLWLNIQDRHDMRGLIIRDFLRHSSGLINL